MTVTVRCYETAGYNQAPTIIQKKSVNLSRLVTVTVRPGKMETYSQTSGIARKKSVNLRSYIFSE